jgi:hypothetical protein
MSGPPALSHAMRVLIVEGDDALEVFDVLGHTGFVIQARSPLLFEVGEELSVRIEHAGRVADAMVRVRAHVGPAAARVTELEVTEGAPWLG